ncbi:NADH pyrophosphatase [Sorochytrium milnesiophthora]
MSSSSSSPPPSGLPPPPSSDPFENAARGLTDALAQQVGSRAALLNSVTDSGWSLLHLAARYGHTATVRMLLERGADASRLNGEGTQHTSCYYSKTAAQVAEFWGFDQVQKLLMTSTNTDGTTQPLSPLERRRALEMQHSFFAGSLLNRFSNLRNDDKAITALFNDPRTQFVVFHRLRPLLSGSTRSRSNALASDGSVVDTTAMHLLSRQDMSRLILANASTLVVRTPGATELLNSSDEDDAGATPLDTDAFADRKFTPPGGWQWEWRPHAEGVVFLGVDEREGDLAYFGVELTDIDVELAVSQAGQLVVAGFAAGAPRCRVRGIREAVLVQLFPDARLTDMRASIPHFAKHESYALVAAALPSAKLVGEADPQLPAAKSTKEALRHSALAAQARGILDWNQRHQFCAGCGRRTVSSEAGYKRACPETSDGPQCISRRPGAGVQNFQYPRTDAAVIVCVMSSDGRKVLLGRQKVWPAGMYSCIAGFLEAGESIEEACRREVFEETGVVVGPVQYIQSQPWPFPNQLMIGCIAEASTSTIDLRDKELEHARWFTVQELTDALKQPILLRDPRPASGTGATEGQTVLKTPPATSLSHMVLHEWLHKWAVRDEAEVKAKI